MHNDWSEQKILQTKQVQTCVRVPVQLGILQDYHQLFPLVLEMLWTLWSQKVVGRFIRPDCTLCDGMTYLLMIRDCSSIKFPSPIITGPSLAMMLALGWTTHRGPMLISPSKVASTQTTASGATFRCGLKNIEYHNNVPILKWHV